MKEQEMAQRMQTMASGVLKDVYPQIAKDIKKESGKDKGVFLDIGGGTGHLCLAMAKAAGFEKLYNLDPSGEMLRWADENIGNASVEKRITNIQGKAEKIPLPEKSVDLIMSRGSSFSWEDPAEAFKEIHRVLNNRGEAYISIGCIFGTEELRKSIVSRFMEKDPLWEAGSVERESKLTMDDVDSLCETAGVRNYRKLIKDHDKWLVIAK